MKNTVKNRIKKNFSIIPNELILDNSLTDRARFLYCLMASKPENWTFYNSALAKELGYSIDTLRKYLNELEEAGWIQRTGQTHDENGKFLAREIELFDHRIGNLPCRKNTDTVKNRHGKKPTRYFSHPYKYLNTVTSTLNKDLKERDPRAREETEREDNEAGERDETKGNEVTEEKLNKDEIAEEEVTKLWITTLGRNPNLPEREETERLLKKFGRERIGKVFREAALRRIRSLKYIIDNLQPDGTLAEPYKNRYGRASPSRFEGDDDKIINLDFE